MGILSVLRLSGVWMVLLVLGFLFFSSNIDAETFKLGLHYDVTTDGHGFDLHKVGNTYVLFLYTYDDNGDPEWFLGVGEWNDGVINGSLDRYTYISTNNPPQTSDPSIEGYFTLDYRYAAVQGACNDGVNRGTEPQMAAFAFKIRDEEYVWCTQFLFGAQANGVPYYGGAWYSLGDEGYGFSMSQQDDTGVAIVYYYDSNKDPRWALAVAPPDGEMKLDNYSGYCRSCPLVERVKDPAGTLTPKWDISSVPGSGSDIASLVLSYPSAPFGGWNREMTLTLITDLAPTAEVEIGEMPAVDFYTLFISRQLVEDSCISCHSTGAVAANTRLVYAENDPAGNLAQFEALFAAEGADYILNKVRGVAHGGSVQAASDSDEYLDLQLLFAVIDGTVTEPPKPAVELFDNVEMLSYEKTLRRAAVILAGRLPTAAEISVARAGNEAQFRATLRNLLSGDGFHQFIIEGANDRLLTDKFLYRTFIDFAMEPWYPEYNRLIIENRELVSSLIENEQYQEAEAEWLKVQGALRWASGREPLELIAYIVERDRPYSELVTADFTMANPLLAQAYRDDRAFPDPDDFNDYQVVWNQGQILRDDTLRVEETPDFNRYISGGIEHTMRHAGVLNSPVLLARYPSTATNRNRARARWTYYFFLGVDIEKSAARTTDPVALADTNNPTLNNPACTVCHQVHDPVAGTFQNHGDTGIYRDAWGGADALSDDYKYAEDSPYQEGDSWYRDMRDPGFYGKLSPDSDNSLQWLGQEIAADPRFGPGTIKFWWPALFGRKPVEAPEESADEDFETQLLAFETQNTYIETLGEQFVTGLTEKGPHNLKDLFVKIIMGPWFRASGTSGTIDPTQAKALEAGYVGAEKLLTPEQLERKTEDLTGWIWEYNGDRWPLPANTAFRDGYRLIYGGIDSDGITSRTTEITSVMSSVVASFAAESSCPIVALDFNLPDAERKLFEGLTEFETPVYEGGQQHTVSQDGFGNAAEFKTTVHLQPGDKHIQIDFLNDYYTEEEGDRNLYLNRVAVHSASGQQVASWDLEFISDIPGASYSPDCSYPFQAGNGSPLGGWAMNCVGFVKLPLTLNAEDDYTVTVTAIGEQAGPDAIEMLTTISDTDPFGQSAGAQKLRERLQQWHYNFLGEDVSLDGPQLSRSYKLLVDTWQRAADDPDSNHYLSQHCALWNYNFTQEEWQRIILDPQYMKGAWRLMLAYFLTDQRYIFE